MSGSGLFLVNKRGGITSRRVVDRVVRVLGTRRVGHAGTLDPFAEGLLLVLWGRATALVPYLLQYSKTYLAGIRFGRVTDTQDRTGLVLQERDASHLDAPTLRAAMLGRLGWIEQVPPSFSAVKQEGQPAYRRARRGEWVDLAPRKRFVYGFELLEWSPPLARCRIVCASGTYVRTLAHDLGRELGTGACLDTLTRTAVGPFLLEHAMDVDALEGMDRTALLALSLEPAAALPDWPSITLVDEETQALVQGVIGPLRDRRLEDASFRALDLAGHLVALVQGGPDPKILRGFRGDGA